MRVRGNAGDGQRKGKLCQESDFSDAGRWVCAHVHLSYKKAVSELPSTFSFLLQSSSSTCKAEFARTTFCGLLHHPYLPSQCSPFLKQAGDVILQHCFPALVQSLAHSHRKLVEKCRLQEPPADPWNLDIWGGAHESAFLRNSLSLMYTIKLETAWGRGMLAKPKESTGEGSAAPPFSPPSSFASSDFPLLQRNEMSFHFCATFAFVSVYAHTYT